MSKTIFFLLVFSLIVTGCDSSKNPAQTMSEHNVVSTTSQPTNTLPASIPTPTVKPTPDGKIQVDWKTVDSGVTAISPSEFKYPFALDSVPVKNYMAAYKVDAKTAQHNLTIGMATNELISKILDQIDTNYVSHDLTAGKGSKLVIHTTPNVMPSEHDYVIEDPFAKGLILPVQLIPDGKK